MRFCFWIIVILSASIAASQEPLPAANGDNDPSAAALVTTSDISDLTMKIDASTDLDDATKTSLQDLCAQAEKDLAKASEETQRAVQFRAWSQTAENDLRELQARLDEPIDGYDTASAEDATLELLVADLLTLEQLREQAKAKLSEAQAEPKRRTIRLGEIPGQLLAERRELEEIEAAIDVAKSQDQASLANQVNVALLAARRQSTLATIASLEAEREAYGKQLGLLQPRIELASAAVEQLNRDIQWLTARIDKLRKLDAAAQQTEAEAALETSPAVLKPFFEENVARAKRRRELIPVTRQATQNRDQIVADLEKWTTDFEQNQTRAELGTSDTLALVLIEVQATLPKTRAVKANVSVSAAKIRAIQEELYLLQDEYSESVESKAADALAELVAAGVKIPPDAEAELLKAAQLESRILGSLIADLSQYYRILIESHENQERLILLLEEYSQFIDRHVFWVRSAPVPRVKSLQDAISALQWLGDPTGWREIASDQLAAFNQNPVFVVVFVAFLAGLLQARRYATAIISRQGEIASRRSCRQFRPTSLTLLLTAVITLPWPLLLWYLGWRLESSPNGLGVAASTSLYQLAIVLLILQWQIQIARPRGLAESHFGWSPGTNSALRSSARFVRLAGLPLVFGVEVFQEQSDSSFSTSAGRLCFVALMIVMAIAARRLLNPRSGVFATAFQDNPDKWASRFAHLWTRALVLLPLFLAFLAIVGFYYTAWRLADYLTITFVLVFGLIILAAILYRWVRLKRRRVRWQQAFDYRERELEVEAGDKDAIAAMLDAEEEDVDLVALDRHSRQLIARNLMFAGLVGIWFIWADAIPALSIVHEHSLWETTNAAGDVVPVTIASLFFAIFVAAITLVAVKNLPSLIEMMLLERLSLEASLRYAISTLLQYTIGAVGIVTACTTLGFSWGKVQWLVAALSVGLGFGLQEVVANFVCGIILLFERPIRVGDVVTLTDTTGVVTKISIRATRIRNWDRQELIIPNKDLITGRIINWTLTDQLNRLVLTVGVAYGVDTRRVREILFDVLDKHPEILEDPRPLVTFEQFGDSSLNFTIRAYLSAMDTRLETIHELNTTIHERFAEEGIEIPFPQRDLHVRTIKDRLQIENQDPSKQESSDV